MNPLRDKDTICAVATPPGLGGISVIRVSGSEAQKLARVLAPFFPVNADSHRSYYGRLIRPSNQEILDEVLVTSFEAGRSFTGEETVEISCHGSPVILTEVLKELIQAGARTAERGEFTYRAFSNGRIDLIQAESVLSLIESKSSAEARNSLRQLEGGLSVEIKSFQKRCLKWLAHIEAGIDFSEEGLEVLSPPEMAHEIKALRGELSKMVAGYKKGRLFREGFRAILLGAPNVGKSSLLNALLLEDRSIVTATAGTTRDLVEGWIDVDGLRVSFLDSAGLRVTGDDIEKAGVDRARAAVDRSDLVFYVIDSAQGLTAEDQKEVEKLKAKKKDLVLVFNKTDLKKAQEIENTPWVSVSAKHPEAARKELLAVVQARIQKIGSFEELMLSQARHFESLRKTDASLFESENLLNEGRGLELVALGIKEALLELQKVLGERFDEQIIDQIFKEFCLGK